MVHGNAEEKARSVLEMIKAEVDVKESIITWVSPGIGVHTGPGVVGIAVMAGVE